MFAWPYTVRFSRPRTCVRWVSAMVKLEANIDAVILRQSVQLQMNELTNPGPWVGCKANDK
jgi:hypothetical protein